MPNLQQNVGDFEDENTVNYWTHNICFEQKYEKSKKIQLKIVIFTAVKNRCILHGRVFVMFKDSQRKCTYTEVKFIVFCLGLSTKWAGLLHMSLVMRKPTFWFPTWSDTNQAVRLQKMARVLKFQI